MSKCRHTTMTKFIPNLIDKGRSIEVTVTNNDNTIDNWIKFNLEDKIEITKIDELRKSLNLNEYFYRQAIGFDIEWKSKFTPGDSTVNKTAIVQISTIKSVLIVQLNDLIPFPIHLERLINDPLFVKVGVGIFDDLEKISSDYNINFNSYIDLSLSYARLTNKDPRGLSFIFEELFNIKLNKPKHIQLSNWEREYLSSQQIEYAAYDALSSILIYNKLKHKKCYDIDNINKYLMNFCNTIKSMNNLNTLSDREVFRQIYIKANESDIFLRYLGDFLIRHESDSINDNFIENIDYTLLIRNFLSRLDLLNGLLSIDNKFLGWIFEFKGQAYHIKGVSSYCTKVIVNDHLLAEFVGNEKKISKNTASYMVLKELKEVQMKISSINIIRDYAGKGILPFEYIIYLNNKPEYKKEISTVIHSDESIDIDID